MTIGDEIAAKAMSLNGSGDGSGYNHDNYADRVLGRPVEAWCADFATWAYGAAGHPMRLLQKGMQGAQQGFAWVGAAVPLVSASSWEGQPGDLYLFSWEGTQQADHVEVCTQAADGQYAYTIGGNSGPSNVDGFRGAGGVHRHRWSAPKGQGNNMIIGVVRVADLLASSPAPAPQAPTPTPAPQPDGRPAWWGTMPVVEKGRNTRADVVVQATLLALGVNDAQGHPLTLDGSFGDRSDQALRSYQAAAGITVDGECGPDTWWHLAYSLAH